MSAHPFTPNYSRLAVVKGKVNKDTANQSGDEFGLWPDCNQHQKEFIPHNYSQDAKVKLILNYIDGWACGASGCNRTPIPKKVLSKRWFVWYRLVTTCHWVDGGMRTSYSIHIWDNHGQRYDHSYIECADPSYYKTLTIQEDDVKYPEPLSDLMIDFIKGAQLPFYRPPTSQRVEPSLFEFQTRLNHFYVSRESVRKDMSELEALRAEVAVLRASKEEQKRLSDGLSERVRHLEGVNESVKEELAEQKALTKVLRMALESLKEREKNNISEPADLLGRMPNGNNHHIIPDVADPVARLNPFDEI